MRKFLLLIFALLSALGWGQTTSVTLQVTDADGQTWNNGTWSVTLNRPPGQGFSDANTFRLANGGSVPNQQQSGSLNASGGASFTLTPNGSITPASTWVFNVCAQATFSCIASLVTINGASQTVTLNLAAIRISMVNPPPLVVAYSDIEILSPSLGQQYYNSTTGNQRQWNGSAWVNMTSGGGGGTPGGANTNLQYNNTGAFGGFADGNSHQVLHGVRTFGAVTSLDVDSSIAITPGTLTLNNFLAGNGNSGVKLADANGVVYSVGTITTDIIPLNITWTTNNAGTTFTGIKFAVTNTASNAASKIFQVCGGASAATCFSLDNSANIVSPGSLTVSAGSSTAGIIAMGGGTQAGLTTNAFTISTQGTSSMTNWNANFPAAAANGIINWTNSTNQVNGAFLTTAANGDLIIGNGTTWTKFAGNASGTKVLQEDASGNFSWATSTANPTLDKSGTGLLNPTADATFTYPIGSTTGFTFAGTAPASVSTATGTNATSLFNISGVTGGADSNATGTAGIGSSPTFVAGAGGAGTGTNTVGGTGGSISFTAGAGGASLGTGANANGGSFTFTPGAAGTGGSGTAGKAGVLQVSGATAGFVGLTQGSANTTVNTNIPANTIIDQAPTAVTAYALTRPGVAASGALFGSNNSSVITENISGDAAHALSQLSKTAAVTTFTLCAATAGTACGQVGQYRISYNFWGSGTACSVVTAGSVGLNLTWTDENAQAHTTVSLPMYDQKAATMGILFNFNTALTTESAGGSFIISTNGTIIQAATTYTACTTGTGTYNLRMTVEQLQ